jgi:hypothetical protein
MSFFTVEDKYTRIYIPPMCKILQKTAEKTNALLAKKLDLRLEKIFIMNKKRI